MLPTLRQFLICWIQSLHRLPIQVKAAPLIADLEASRKVAGFLAHAATMFCSFCLCTQDQIEDLNLDSWQLRNGAEVRAQAEAWLDQTTKAGREALETRTGVRWTPLHHLPYWDPVKHVVLGFMHNWLEGVLQHHLRTLWGIGRDQGESEKAKEVEKDEQWTEADVSDSADELDDLLQEAAEHDPEAAMAIDNIPHTPPKSLSPLTSASSTPTISSFTLPSYSLCTRPGGLPDPTRSSRRTPHVSPPASVLPPPASVLIPPDPSFLYRRIPDSRLIVAPRVPHTTIQFLQGTVQFYQATRLSYIPRAHQARAP
ncbi:putative transposase family tnp2 [Lyophyllum shimeji]|uniref:Transposase family tnp2 n=1 Tax=Lyophyllum shimeji TaxID=47721 RepID=A0A9P3PM36_LYOSH|nr:putative transposase family tnp2 [Lyophyllum shimeji]